MKREPPLARIERNIFMHNSTTPSLIISAFLALACSSCDKKSDPAPDIEVSSTAVSTNEHMDGPGSHQGHDHAPAGVKPGSHEDWCGEHQVPESQCTRCNPSLIAAFKATGDWCQEHKLPESQCLACNPDLNIERPPKETANP